MRARELPRELPDTFLEIWRALDGLAQRCRSRQMMARQLGVSTSTLHRILVTGAVPDFRQRQSVRVVHAWARTLARIAAVLGESHRAWIEGVGIDWSEPVRQVAEAALDGAGSRGQLRRAELAVVGEEWPAAMRIAVADRAPFQRTLPGLGKPFGEVYGRALAGAVAPRGVIRTHVASEVDAIRCLLRRGSAFDVAVGVVITASRLREGIDFVPIPGLRVCLGAVAVVGCEHPATGPSLGQLLSDPGGWRWVLPADNIASDFLLGQGLVGVDSIRFCPASEPEGLAEALVREAGSQGCRRLVALAETSWCRTILERSGACLSEGCGLRTFELSAQDAPCFRIGVAFRKQRTEIGRLLAKATDLELFGSGREQTAWLYACLAAVCRDDAGTPFVEVPAAPIDQRFVRVMLAELDRRGVDRKVLPVGWRALCGRTVARRPAAGQQLCRSCLADLSVAHNIGPSTAYCRYCADDDGRLRPRAEVQQVLARWLSGLHGGLSSDAATETAAVYMQAMPQWRETIS